MKSTHQIPELPFGLSLAPGIQTPRAEPPAYAHYRGLRSVCACLIGLVLALSSSSVRAASDDDNWDDRFAWALIQGSQMRAVASSGSNVYFGGSFITVGGSTGVGSGVSATNIAVWNGRNWAPLGGGVNGQVYAIALRGNDVYVGGEFTQAGGVAAANVARWDGTNWWPVGSGTDDRVYTLAFNGNDLYAGGEFAVAGGNTARLIAKWNGANWSSVGAGLGNVGSVRAIAFLGSDMYASGDFNSGGLLNIARWDGANWLALSGELGNTADTAYALAVIGNDLYVGGTFLTAGGLDTKRIARWNGANWSSVGAGITAAAVGIFTMVADGTNLYVAGGINAAGGIATRNIAKWDGANWSAIGPGIQTASVVNGLVYADDGLYAGGAFLDAGGLHAYNAARWDGTNWWALGQGMDNAVLVLASHGSNIYAGGWFSRAGGVFGGNVAAWNGNRWNSVGNVDFSFAEIRAIVASGTNVYVGGSFPGGITNGVGFSANGIARWTGISWSGLGSGLRYFGTNGLVRAIAAAPDGTVYAGGIFTQAGGAAATNIARYYTNWQTVGTAPNPGVNGEVMALALAGNDLYVGGAFTNAGGVSAVGVARWDGSAWSAVGSGLTGTVMALATNGADVYAGGKFTNSAAGITNIAKWIGSSWSALGGGIGSTTNDFVAAIAVNGNDVYVGGRFTNAGGVLASNIARWNGSAWSALGSGVSPGQVLNPPVVRALDFHDDALHVGGHFVTAGGKPSYGFAIWHPRDSGQPPGTGPLLASVATLPDGNLIITWNSTPNVNYQILSTTNLPLPFAVFVGPIPSGGTTTSFTNSSPADPVRFFQIKQLP